MRLLEVDLKLINGREQHFYMQNEACSKSDTAHILTIADVSQHVRDAAGGRLFKRREHTPDRKYTYLHRSLLLQNRCRSFLWCTPRLDKLFFRAAGRKRQAAWHRKWDFIRQRV